MRRARPKGRWRDGLIAPSDGGWEGRREREEGRRRNCIVYHAHHNL